MNVSLQIGTRVMMKEGSRGMTNRRYGEVIETGPVRLRVQWDYLEQTDNETDRSTISYRVRGKRTWVKASRLVIVPTEVL